MEGRFVVGSSPVKQLIQEYSKIYTKDFFLGLRQGREGGPMRVEACVDTDKGEWTTSGVGRRGGTSHSTVTFRFSRQRV
jgi:hypothetical protein